MKSNELNYCLPGELVAQQPSEVRSESRLLFLGRSVGELVDSRFEQLRDFLLPGDCLVLNDTRVLPAKFFASRGTGGKIEGLFLKVQQECIWEVILKGAGKVRIGERVQLKDRKGRDFCRAVLIDKMSRGRYRLRVETGSRLEKVLDEIGFPPLPPYIKRDNELDQAEVDKLRYQTVYARKIGAVAAPTAGLHFTNELMRELKDAGVRFAYITLHVGFGTFRPITAENLEDHQMHEERFGIDSKNARIINETREAGGRIIAVGTTSVRTLETASDESRVKTGSGKTSLFIKPGYKFKIVDGMLTNFHLPKSTLLALVAAFAGLEKILAAYDHAVKQKYRFYSYGDAMLIV